MKHLVKLVSTIVVSSAVFSSSALACSYQIDQISKKNELMAAGASYLRVSLENVNRLGVQSFSFFESKPTPMCPEELTYNSEIYMDYMDATALRFTRCTVALQVTKIENWKTNLEQFVVKSTKPVCKILQ